MMRLLRQSIAAQVPLHILLGTVYSKSLQAWHYAPLHLGEIKPIGWLLGETRATANGLFGHEHEFYVYVSDSSWLRKPGTGGAEYSNLNEALPYWFNSIVPLAYTLDDDRLKGQIQAVAKTVLGFQHTDGWIGPEIGDSRNLWSRIPMFLGLTQLADANRVWEEPIVDSLQRFMLLTNTMLKNNSQGFSKCDAGIDCTWGQARIHDLIITIQWLIEKHPSSQEPLLWENMELLYDQNQFKWDVWYSELTYPKIVKPSDALAPYIHGVNVAQGLKASSVFYRNTGNQDMISKSHDAVDWTFQYHGSASGTILADEHQTGLEPHHGSELCTAVETIYSLAYLYQMLGDNLLADKAERTLFNAFPVMMTGDKWAHQYMTQPNQPWAMNTSKDDGQTPPIFTTANSGLATVFGMEPLYPCCTVNYGQGYPKFIANSWVRVGTTGLGHALLSPSRVATSVNDGVVTIVCNTSYPFDNILSYNVSAEKDFDLFIRVPDWATDYTIKTERSSSLGSTTNSSSAIVKGLQRIPIKAGSTKLTYTIGVGIRTEKRPGDTVAVFYGNLLYALDVGFSQTSSWPHAYYDTKGPGLDHMPFPQLRDYYIKSTKPWNVAVDPSTLQYYGARGRPLMDPIFEHGQPPNFMTVQGCEIKWDLYMNTTPGQAPHDRTCIGKEATYKLIPYGAAKVHMVDLPVVKF